MIGSFQNYISLRQSSLRFLEETLHYESRRTAAQRATERPENTYDDTGEPTDRASKSGRITLRGHFSGPSVKDIKILT